MENINRFNIRVYGLLIENGQLLIVDEIYKERNITKYPGGGLNPGEGTIDCLQREIKEELNMDVEVTGHFYTTDFFQQSVFRENEQVFSIYYHIKRPFPNQPINYNWQEVANGHKVKFRWIPLEEITAAMFTFAIDKKVAEMLIHSLK